MTNQIEGQLNPVIAGFDILYLGKKGFTTLARATRAKIRSKGKRGKWIELKFTKRHKRKAQKEFALYNLLKKLSFARDLKKKKAAKKPLAKLKKPTKPKAKKQKPAVIVPPTREETKNIIKERAPELTSRIKFRAPKIIEKVITTRDRSQISIKKYEYKLTRAINFSSGRNYEAPVVNEFIQAVKAEFKKIYKKHGRKDYLVQIHHQYKNFINYYDAYPEDLPKGMKKSEVKDKGFGGFSLNRQEFANIPQINDQFDSILAMKYLGSFSRYLNFSNPSTEFNFSGFMIEVTTKIIKKPPRR
jgi:hypothetical protein